MKFEFSVKMLVLGVKLFISQCTYFATLNGSRPINLPSGPRPISESPEPSGPARKGDLPVLPPVGRLFAPVPVPARPGVIVTCRSDDPGRREDLADPTLPIPGAAGVPNPPDDDFWRRRPVGGPIAPLPPDRRLSPFFAEDTIEVKLIRPPGECPPPEKERKYINIFKFSVNYGVSSQCENFHLSV